MVFLMKSIQIQLKNPYWLPLLAKLIKWQPVAHPPKTAHLAVKSGDIEFMRGFNIDEVCYEKNRGPGAWLQKMPYGI
jgi:hypothetical protein